MVDSFQRVLYGMVQADKGLYYRLTVVTPSKHFSSQEKTEVKNLTAKH